MIFVDHFNSTDKNLCVVSAITGWFIGLHFISVNWGPVLASLMSIVSAGVSAFAGAVIIDFYKLKIKNKLFKNEKSKSKKSNKAA